MKPAEFRKIEADFKRKQERWENLFIGQKVYESFARYWDMEYFEHTITGIDIENRTVDAIDHSRNNREVELYGFRTIEELRAEGIELGGWDEEFFQEQENKKAEYFKTKN